jgi:hypothetical protein
LIYSQILDFRPLQVLLQISYLILFARIILEVYSL